MTSKAPSWHVPPTYAGRTGRAWHVDLSKLVHARPDTEATIASWILNVQAAHPFWSWWFLATVHLRPIPGAKPAHVVLPGATHELLVMALDPAHEPPNPAAFREDDVHGLRPIDVTQQYVVRNDADAVDLAELCARACCDGVLSPDQDFRRLWEYHVTGTARHIAAGGHGWPS